MPSSSSFLHLHTHSTFSDGSASPRLLVERAKALGFSALALTDHNTLDGHPALLTACAQYGIQPVLGVEMRVYWEHTYGHALVLARNAAEYERLRALLRRHRKIQVQDVKGCGVLTTACLGGIPAQRLVRGDYYGARDALEAMHRLLGDGLVVEVQPAFGTMLPWLLSLARQLALPVVATNDVHHVGGAGHLSLCSADEMAARCQLPGYQEALAYSATLASQCRYSGLSLDTTEYPEGLPPQAA